MSCKSCTSPREMQFVPVWAPIWSLYSITVMAMVAVSFPQVQMTFLLDWNSQGSLFLSMFNFELEPFWVCAVMALPTTFFCFQKLDGHKLMLDQMASFDLRNAQCTLETDRVVLQRQVVDLFDEALEPPLFVSFGVQDPMPNADSLAMQMEVVDHAVRHVTSYPTPDEVIDQFNAYVRGPLRDRAVSLMGHETDISMKLCIVFNLPLYLLGLVMVWGCYGQRDCEASASHAGYPSVSQYLLCNVTMNFIITPALSTLLFPMALRVNYWVTRAIKGGVWRVVSGSFCTTLVIFVTNCLQSTGASATVVIVNRCSTMWLVSYIGACILVSLLAWFLFKPHKRFVPSQRPLAAW